MHVMLTCLLWYLTAVISLIVPAVQLISEVSLVRVVNEGAGTNSELVNTSKVTSKSSQEVRVQLDGGYKERNYGISLQSNKLLIFK